MTTTNGLVGAEGLGHSYSGGNGEGMDPNSCGGNMPHKSGLRAASALLHHVFDQMTSPRPDAAYHGLAVRNETHQDERSVKSFAVEWVEYGRV